MYGRMVLSDFDGSISDTVAAIIIKCRYLEFSKIISNFEVF